MSGILNHPDLTLRTFGWGGGRMGRGKEGVGRATGADYMEKGKGGRVNGEGEEGGLELIGRRQKGQS